MKKLISFGCCCVSVSCAVVVTQVQGAQCNAKLISGCSPGDPKMFICSSVLYQDGRIVPVEQGQFLSKWWGECGCQRPGEGPYTRSLCSLWGEQTPEGSGLRQVRRAAKD